MPVDERPRPPLDLKALAQTLIAVLRADGHLCNVLTHVARGNWRSIESAFEIILAPRSHAAHLDPVARNVLALICDERGVTGPIMKAVVFGLIGRSAGARQAQQLKWKIMRLRKAVAAADQAASTCAADKDVGVTPPAAVVFEHDGICVDAAVIADGLALDPASVPRDMQRGAIRAICERGVGADDGFYRLTFLRSRYRVQLIVANDGNVRERSMFTVGNMSGDVQRRSA
jgi:hypothetical protein